MKFQIDNIRAKGTFYSEHLKRWVHFRFVAPAHYLSSSSRFRVLLMNDGQDYDAMDLEKTLTQSFANKSLHSFIYIGISCNEDRMHEYGTASMPDFKGRGSKAAAYSKFITSEFIPFLKKEFKASKKGKDWVYCGMSLGGISAFDIAYGNADKFGKIGVFSGSFWWRKKAYVKKDIADRSRIILDLIKNEKFAPHLKFWLQCGTEDETADRNENGIIDAIDDTQDVIKELNAKGYSKPNAITYVEVKGGKHNLPTWGKVFPEFIQWAFSVK